MISTPVPHCDCCGLPVDPGAVEDCPRCGYPVSPVKEERFLASAISDLQRVANYGGANLRVVDLIHRYQKRLNSLRMTAPVVPVALALPAQAGAIAVPVIRPLAPEEEPAAFVPQSQQPPRRVFSWKSFFADQAINIVASLGAFLILVGALSFTATTSSLLLSFLVVFAVHAVFGITGFITYRFPTFRIVAIIYTVIFALLVPLVGFSAYRLVTGSNIEFSIPTLVAVAAIYAAIVYTVLAIYQRFIPFAYLGAVALVVAELAIADALGLAYWWWPGVAMLLAIPALVSARRPSGTSWPFTSLWAVLRVPVRFVMYAIVVASVLGLLSTTAYSLQLDASGAPLREVRFAVLSMTLLLLLWTSLILWLAKRTRVVIVLAYMLLASVLAFCYAFAFEPIGYALALTLVALLYHGLNRFAGRLIQPFGVLGLGLDQVALALVFVVPFISSPLLPMQLFARVYAAPIDMRFQTNWQVAAELVAVAFGILLTISVTFSRAGLVKTAVRAAWCWLLLSGFLLNWGYSMVVLALNLVPAWSFLGLALAAVALAVVVRKLFGAAWANPLDVLALFGIVFALSLSLDQNRDVISALLLAFAMLLYAVLLYQRRQNWLFLPLIFALSALPALWDRPLALLLMGLLLPLASVVIHQLISRRWHVPPHPTGAINRALHLANMWEWPLLAAGLAYGMVVAVHDVVYATSAIQNALNVPVALELALLALAWYASAALMGVKPWLVPSVGFAVGALLIPGNSFWVLLCLTPVLALLGVGISRFAGRDWALPLYIVALLGAVMTGDTGLTRDHLLATAWVLLGFAALAYIIGMIEDTPVAMWVMPVFATWSVIVATGFLGDLYRPPIVALACAALGVCTGFLNLIATGLSGSTRKNSLLAYALPFYATALAAAVLTGVYGTLADINRPFYGAVPDALLVYALVAFAVLLFERQPRWLWLVAGLAAWATWLWEPALGLVRLMIAYSLLCLLIFAGQFAWRAVLPASRWLSAATLHVILGLGGQVLVVLFIIGQGGLSADSGQLVHVGAGALLELAVMVSWYGRLQRARAVRHWCYYAAGLLLSLVVSWELSAFHQTRFDVLMLAPASYLSVVAPFLMRDETLAERHWAGQVVSLVGAALLLLPALWFSFSDNNLAPTLVLVGESVALLLLGIATRLRVFVLGSASLLVTGTLRALFLETPPSLALMVLGGTLVAIATALFLVRRKLQLVWTHLE